MKKFSSFQLHKIIFSVFFLFIFFFSTHLALASSTSGYAWSENTGYIDFSKVTVESGSLSGYAYSSNIGWISMNCINTDSCDTNLYKVLNHNGTLSGYAWSENTGYIDFSGVTISGGTFSGYAYSPNIGWISLNCKNTSSCGDVDYKVTTSWKPQQQSGSSAGLIATFQAEQQALTTTPSATTAPDCLPNYTFNPSTGKPCVTTPPLPATTCTITHTLTLWSKGDEVKCLQTTLKITSDGIFGPKTYTTVVAFQKSHNLKPDGVVGPITRALLN